jgi:erythromycin esterase
LDLYSLWESMEAVIEYLKKVDPDAVRAAYDVYNCFEPYGKSVENYARATAFVPESCEDEGSLCHNFLGSDDLIRV